MTDAQIQLAKHLASAIRIIDAASDHATANGREAEAIYYSNLGANLSEPLASIQHEFPKTEETINAILPDWQDHPEPIDP